MATYKGTDARLRAGEVYNIITFDVSGYRYDKGEREKDLRVQVYLTLTRGNDFHKMYENAEAVMKDWDFNVPPESNRVSELWRKRTGLKTS